MFTSLLKNMIKDPDEQPDEEIHGVRSSCPRGAGLYHPPGTRVGSPTRKLSRPPPIRIFMGTSSHGCDQLLILFVVPPCHSGEVGGNEES